MLLQKGSHRLELCGGELETTNNRMEMTAVIKALEALKKPSRVRLTTDSQYVMKGVTEWMENWKKRQWKTASRSAVKNVDLWKRIDQLVAVHEIEWVWVKGHSGHVENELVDTLANRGIDELLRRTA